MTITGFMGTGKTCTGRILAEMMGLSFVDLDEFIEAGEGRTVQQIFAQDGEADFRRLEERACRELCRRDGLVVATGGGTLLNERNLCLLSRRGPVFLLEASIDAILARLGDGTGRPLLAGCDGNLRGRIQTLLQERSPDYHRIPHRIDTTRLSPLATACHLAARLQLPAHTVAATIPGGQADMASAGNASARGSQPGMTAARSDIGATGNGATAARQARVEIGCGLLSQLGARLATMEATGGVFIFMPPNVSTLYRAQIAASLERAGIRWTEIPIDDGDAQKTWQQAGSLLARLAEHAAARDAIAVAVGGGVTGDLVGFVAAVYMRGLRLVQVPTTLLAQVDASIGGKVGVNSRHAKNLAGAFHWPHLVLSDPCTLRSLPELEIASGMAEVVKSAIIGAPELFLAIERRLMAHPGPLANDIVFLESCVRSCAAVKAAITSRDPFESGERLLLNLGHSVGHALETAQAYEGLTHGQAVSIGIVIALGISVQRRLMAAGLVERVRNVLQRCGLPVTFPAGPPGRVLANLQLDKKRRRGRLRYVLPVDLGQCIVVEDVSEAEIQAAIARVSGQRKEPKEPKEPL